VKRVGEQTPVSQSSASASNADGEAASSVGGASQSGESTKAASDKTWTVLELLKWTTDYFSRNGIDSARIDAEVLLAHALETERLRLYIDYEKPVLPEERDRYRGLVQRRAQERVPVSQLLGEREFWSLAFKVTSDVLTPRPETETLVEFALSKSASGAFTGKEGSPAAGADPELTTRILDIGTGSGAIALSLASELPHAAITATDLSERALQIAAENADHLHMRERVRFLEGDLFEPVASERFDLIVSNPPYVARADEGSCPPELSHEPEMALFSGHDGLDVIRRLVKEAGDHLSPGGWLGIELSPEQAETVEQELVLAGFAEVERRFDLASRPRVVGARWPEN
jgi:release factor glutamine methyltransferase